MARFCMYKLLVIGVLGLFLVGIGSSYICIYPETDNQQVQDFKMKINQLAVQEDIDNGITEEGFNIKLKYFSPCR